ncbi:MAG: hypothetical protein ACLT8E_04505 [Akkermansia sp.]
MNNDTEMGRVTVRHTVREDKGGRVVLRGKSPWNWARERKRAFRRTPPLAAPRLWVGRSQHVPRDDGAGGRRGKVLTGRRIPWASAPWS